MKTLGIREPDEWHGLSDNAKETWLAFDLYRQRQLSNITTMLDQRSEEKLGVELIDYIATWIAQTG